MLHSYYRKAFGSSAALIRNKGSPFSPGLVRHRRASISTREALEVSESNSAVVLLSNGCVRHVVWEAKGY